MRRLRQSLCIRGGGMGTNPSFISVSESVNRGQTPIYAVVGARLSSSQYIWSNSGPSCIVSIDVHQQGKRPVVRAK